MSEYAPCVWWGTSVLIIMVFHEFGSAVSKSFGSFGESLAREIERAYTEKYQWMFFSTLFGSVIYPIMCFLPYDLNIGQSGWYMTASLLCVSFALVIMLLRFDRMFTKIRWAHQVGLCPNITGRLNSMEIDSSGHGTITVSTSGTLCSFPIRKDVRITLVPN